MSKVTVTEAASSRRSTILLMEFRTMTEFQKLDVSDFDPGGTVELRYKFCPVDQAPRDERSPYLPLSISVAKRHSPTLTSSDREAIRYALRRRSWLAPPFTDPIHEDYVRLWEAVKRRLPDDIAAVLGNSIDLTVTHFVEPD